MSAERSVKVVFQPSGKRGEFAAGTPVLDAARELGVQIESVCGGRGICGRCQVELACGAFPKLGIESGPDALSAFGKIEQRYADKRDLAEGRRLSCSTQLLADAVIDVPSASIVAGQTIRKDANTIGMNLNPAVRPYYVELAEPDLHDPTGDTDRLINALQEEFGLGEIHVSLSAIEQIQTVLKAAKFKATVVVAHSGDDAGEIISVLPGYEDQLFGLAVDIGSTTVALHLVDLSSGEILQSSGRANPQIRFGEDLMSRVSYVMMNEGGLKRLTQAVRAAINEMVDEVAQKAQIDLAQILDSVFVANPVMHHVFLGLDPTPLGQAPFNPAISAAVNCPVSDLGLNLGSGARAHVFPIVAGHVGADAAAVVLAQNPSDTSEPVLIVDVGTNAEIVLWDGTEFYAASSPTGPALEGAEISCGQRAAPGAIERIRVDLQSLEAKYKIIGSDLWNDAEGFEESISETGVSGLCGSAIIEIVGELLRAGIINPDGVIRGPQNAAEEGKLVANGRTFSYVIRAQSPRLEITQNDVRAIQLAKAALYAGVKLLMDHAGIETVKQVRLAGAFGTFIDPAYALLLGLVPDCAVENVTSVGNAAGQGALMGLLDRDQRTKVAELVGRIHKIETALEPAFQDHFVHAMGVPNSADPFPLTREIFGLSKLIEKTDAPKRRRRRRN